MCTMMALPTAFEPCSWSSRVEQGGRDHDQSTTRRWVVDLRPGGGAILDIGCPHLDELVATRKALVPSIGAFHFSGLYRGLDEQRFVGRSTHPRECTTKAAGRVYRRAPHRHDPLAVFSPVAAYISGSFYK